MNNNTKKPFVNPVAEAQRRLHEQHRASSPEMVVVIMPVAPSSKSKDLRFYPPTSNMVH